MKDPTASIVAFKNFSAFLTQTIHSLPRADHYPKLFQIDNSVDPLKYLAYDWLIPYIFILSAVKYFDSWGWAIDEEGGRFKNRAMQQFSFKSVT